MRGRGAIYIKQISFVLPAPLPLGLAPPPSPLPRFRNTTTPWRCPTCSAAPFRRTRTPGRPRRSRGGKGARRRRPEARRRCPRPPSRRRPTRRRPRRRGSRRPRARRRWYTTAPRGRYAPGGAARAWAPERPSSCSSIRDPSARRPVSAARSLASCAAVRPRSLSSSSKTMLCSCRSSLRYSTYSTSSYKPSACATKASVCSARPARASSATMSAGALAVTAGSAAVVIAVARSTSVGTSRVGCRGRGRRRRSRPR